MPLSERSIAQLVDAITTLSERVGQLETIEYARPNIYFTTTWNVPVTLADAVSSNTFAVTGAETEDVVGVTHDGIGATNWLFTAHVESSGQVRVIALNKTGGAVGLTGDVYLIVFK